MKHLAYTMLRGELGYLKTKTVKRREVWECDGWVWGLKGIGHQYLTWYVKLEAWVIRDLPLRLGVCRTPPGECGKIEKSTGNLWMMNSWSSSCLLWNDRARAKHRTNVKGSVWWKTKRESGVHGGNDTPHIHYVERGTGIPKDKDEVKRREVWECDGWVWELEGIGAPSIFKVIRKATVAKNRNDLDRNCVYYESLKLKTKTLFIMNR
jgi:hypothetical protein